MTAGVLNKSKLKARERRGIIVKTGKLAERRVLLDRGTKKFIFVATHWRRGGVHR